MVILKGYVLIPLSDVSMVVSKNLNYIYTDKITFGWLNGQFIDSETF